MGMDQYIYQTARRDFERVEGLRKELGRLEAGYNAEYAEKIEELGRKYPGWTERASDADFLLHEFSPEDREACDGILTGRLGSPEYRKLQDELDGLEPKDELRYWRKAYGLHSWMSAHARKAGRDDNCEAMVLTPGILDALTRDLAEGIRSLKSNGDSPFIEPGSYYNMEDMESDLEFFSNLSQAAADPDTVVYYYAWY